MPQILSSPKGSFSWRPGCHTGMLIPVSDRTFFSDRTGHPVQRAGEEITANVWRGLVPLIQRRIADGSLARDFPLLGCEDGDFITGTDEQMFIDSLRAHVPQAADWPLNPARLPATPVALDILEFVAMHLVQPSGRSPHSYFRHPHLFFRDDQWLDAATEQFRHDVDLIFARNGIAFTFGDDLRIRGSDQSKPVSSSRSSGQRPETWTWTPSSWTR